MLSSKDGITTNSNSIDATKQMAAQLEKQNHRTTLLKSQMANKFMGKNVQPYEQSGKCKLKPQRDANPHPADESKLNT